MMRADLHLRIFWLRINKNKTFVQLCRFVYPTVLSFAALKYVYSFSKSSFTDMSKTSIQKCFLPKIVPFENDSFSKSIKKYKKVSVQNSYKI